MATLVRVPLHAAPVDAAAARRSLAAQIARLDGELAAFVDVPPPGDGVTRGPRLLTLSELERVRDGLVERLAAARRAADARGREQALNRRLREEMLLDPGRHALLRVKNGDVGEPGCCDWHVRPRFGLLGMLMRWWRVRISSGCP